MAMEKVVTVQEMLSVEKEADQRGLCYAEMMENAGRGIAEIVDVAYSHNKSEQILALVGTGNNGGDALVALNYLADWGWKVKAYVVKTRAENDPLIRRLIDKNIPVVGEVDQVSQKGIRQVIDESRIILDGILGTGFRLPLKPDLAVCMKEIRDCIRENKNNPSVIAVDCPSGVDCDDGNAAEECTHAEMTITMAAPKTGFYHFPAASLVGKIRVAKIGNLDHVTSWVNVNRWVANNQHISEILPARPQYAHKGTFGTAVIVAGSKNYLGAALLSGKAAYRSGAGWVTVAMPESIYPYMAGNFIEATWMPLPDENGQISVDAVEIILNNMPKKPALLIGPGLGLSTSTKNFLYKLFTSPGILSQAVVLDADGLKLMSTFDMWPKLLPPDTILTPHPGEMAIITNRPVYEIQKNRILSAEQYAKEWGHIVVLKGPYTVVAGPDGRTVVVPVATPALAKAGSGDVLAGLITGLRAQGLGAFHASIAGTYIHALCGLDAELRLGNSASVMAGDVLESISSVITKLK